MIPILYGCVSLYKVDGYQYLGDVCRVHWTNDPNAGVGGSSGGESSGGNIGGTPAPLTDAENKKLQKAINKVKKNLDKKKCGDFLKSRGISLADLRTTLDTYGRYSATRSTGITAKQAGFYSPAEVERLQNLPPTSTGFSGKDVLNQTVREILDSQERSGGDVKAIAARYATNPSAYYDNDGFKEVTALHENLHISTGKDDVGLALQLTGQDFGRDYKSASGAISKALRENGYAK